MYVFYVECYSQGNSSFFQYLSIKGKIKYKVSFVFIFQINLELCELFGTKQIVISQASQTVNPTESTPSTIKTFLSKHCADHPDNWDDHLSAVSFAFNVIHLVCAFLYIILYFGVMTISWLCEVLLQIFVYFP